MAFRKTSWALGLLTALAALALSVVHAQSNPPTPTDDPELLKQIAQNLPNRGAAPELHEGIWLNSSAPLKLANLRGQVVLLEMWTFDCINCKHVIPSVRTWYDTYKDEGLVVIANHYPEFGYERDLDNLRSAIVRLDVPYPVLQDNGRETWSAYSNRYWPALYLIDKWGNVRYVHFGEGRYEETERAIRALLQEAYSAPEDAGVIEKPLSLTANVQVNVRSGPGTTHSILGAIYPNEAYYVLGEENGWYKIKFFEGQEGFVSGDYVTVSSAAT